MRLITSGLSLPSGISILFVIKGIQGSGKSSCPLPSSAWVKGASPVGHSSASYQCVGFLFQLQAAILGRLVTL